MELCVHSMGMLRKQDSMLAHSNPTPPLYMCVCVMWAQRSVSVWMHTRTALYEACLPQQISQSPEQAWTLKSTHLWQYYAIHPRADVSTLACCSEPVWQIHDCVMYDAVTYVHVPWRPLSAKGVREQDKDYRTVEWETSLESHKHVVKCTGMNGWH